jgi:hypothetical protein
VIHALLLAVVIGIGEAMTKLIAARHQWFAV